MTTESPGDSPPATPARESKRPHRGHAALGARILVAGVGSAATIALTALMARAELGSEAAPQPTTAAVSTASPAATTAPLAPVVRVVIRRPAPAAAGSASAPTRPAPAAATPAPAPPPAPAPAAVPVTRSQTS